MLPVTKWRTAFFKRDRQKFLRYTNEVLGEGAVKFSGENALVSVSHAKDEYKNLLKPRNHKTIRGVAKILQILDEGKVPFPAAAEVGPEAIREEAEAVAPLEPLLAVGARVGEASLDHGGGLAAAVHPEVFVAARVEEGEPSVAEARVEEAGLGYSRGLAENQLEANQAAGHSTSDKPSAREKYLALIDTLADLMKRNVVQEQDLRAQIEVLEAELDDEIDTDEEVAMGHSFMRQIATLRQRKEEHKELKDTVEGLSERMGTRIVVYTDKCKELANVLKNASEECKKPLIADEPEVGVFVRDEGGPATTNVGAGTSEKKKRKGKKKKREEGRPEDDRSVKGRGEQNAG